MKPLSLELIGFIGIQKAFGRDKLTINLQNIPEHAKLVALVGRNGAAKTTILDNLHPYRVMPSRSTTLGPGGFSYWDHVAGPNASKELVWVHGGITYRTSLVFKQSGKSQHVDNYLFELDVEGWKPVLLDDGTKSDGTARTYDACVDAILGPPERFFTSQFSAQLRKSVSAYTPGDIKSLLASVLNLVHFRKLASDAAMVGKLLRPYLHSLNEELKQLAGIDKKISDVNAQIDQVDRDAALSEGLEKQAIVDLDAARQALSMLEAKRDSQAKDVAEASFLTDQIASAKTKAESAKQQLTLQHGRETAAIDQNITQAQETRATIETGIRTAAAEFERVEAILQEREEVSLASNKIPALRLEIEAIEVDAKAKQEFLAELPAIQQQLLDATALQASITTEGKSKKIMIETLTQTASLINQVPCNGSPLQTSCPLLEQANLASNQLPAYMSDREVRLEKYHAVTANIKVLQAKATQLAGIQTEVNTLHEENKAKAKMLERLSASAARQILIDDAATKKPQLQSSIAELRAALVKVDTDLAAGQKSLATVAQSLQLAITHVNVEHAIEVKQLSDRLLAIPTPVQPSEIDLAGKLVTAAEKDLQARRIDTKAYSEKRSGLLAQKQNLLQQLAQSKLTEEEAERVHVELSKYKLIEKGMGNDGCIALCIDDAGPEIAVYCNNLLKACFDGRFIVRLDTQKESASGDVRETFNVQVFDTLRGNDAKLVLMSGGERVLINECLTRGVALHADRDASSKCQTLFTDETDGALDEVTKRQFMQMKRAVLAQGGYDREYFISHIPELWEMADHKIYVEEL